MTLISSETWRETSIRSLASIFFIKSELPCRVLRTPGVILNSSYVLDEQQPWESIKPRCCWSIPSMPVHCFFGEGYNV